MEAANQLQIMQAEKLIALIARAFYTDNVIVLIDALLYEKYIIEEELGPRLRISNKEIEKVKNLLIKEGFIKFEKVTVKLEAYEAAWNCCYIDYQSFINLVRYRVYLMEKYLVSEEDSGLNTVYYECPTCKKHYSSLEVQRQLTGDFKFVCSYCFPGNDIRSWKNTEDYYKLIEVDNRNEIGNIQNVRRKVEDQLRYQTAKWNADGSANITQEILLHEGIYELLAELKDIKLPRNLPSENIQKGHTSSAIVDKDMANETQYNLEQAKAGKYGSHMKKKTLDQVKDNLAAGKSLGNSIANAGPTVEITYLPEGAELPQSSGGGVDGRGKKVYNQDEATFEASKPEFLRGSHVYGGEKVAQSLQAKERDRNTINVKEEGDEEVESQVVKKARQDDYQFSSTASAIAPYMKEEIKLDVKEEKKEEEEEEDDEENDLFDEADWEQEDS